VADGEGFGAVWRLVGLFQALVERRVKILFGAAGRLEVALDFSSIATKQSARSPYGKGDATGFIRLNALRLKVRALREEK